MLRLPVPFSCASPNLGEKKNECREHCERFIAEGRKEEGNNASLCNSSSLCNVWLFTKETLDTKLGSPLYLCRLPEITPKVHIHHAATM